MMTPEEIELCDFIKIAVHEVAHALQCSRCGGIDIIRNPEGASLENKAFLGKTFLFEKASPQIAIAGELANFLYDTFVSENAKPEWPEDFTFWPDDFVDSLEMEMNGGAASETDSAPLRHLSNDELSELASEVAAVLRSQWTDLLRLVGILVEQREEIPRAEGYGFTNEEWRRLS